jgi:hypothetical protein
MPEQPEVRTPSFRPTPLAALGEEVLDVRGGAFGQGDT